jgi:DNA-binding SARP family transcriptional activator
MTGDNEACLTAVREGLRIADETGVRLWDFMLLAQASFATLTAGDLDGARSVHERMDFISGTGRKLDIAHYHYHLGWEAMCRGDFPLALEHMEMGLKAAEETGEPFIAAFISMGVAEVLIELGDCKKAKRYLDEARRIGVLMRSNTVEYQYSWIEAVRCLREGDRKKAMSSLRHHLAISREFGILNHAAWRSSVMVPLYALALEEGIEVEHVRALIKKRKLSPSDAIEKYEASSPLRGEGRELPSNILIGGVHWPWAVKIYTLGRFEIFRDDKPVQFSGKVQKKPLEMLKVLIAFGGRNVSEERIIDALWPDAEGHLGQKSFETTLQRLRRLIGNDKALLLQDGRLTLDERLCWMDARAFEEAVRSSECGVRNEKENPLNSESASRNLQPEMEKAISLYRGHFLPSDTRLAWSAVARERLRSRLLRLILKAGETFENAGEWRRAGEMFEQGIEKDAACEEFYQHLMACFKNLGQEARAAEVYNRCRKMLSQEFGLQPSSRTEEIRRSLNSEKRD